MIVGVWFNFSSTNKKILKIAFKMHMCWVLQYFSIYIIQIPAAKEVGSVEDAEEGKRYCAAKPESAERSRFDQGYTIRD